jgi:exo-beta-1,3-glucanase (GH17 family)
MKSTWARSTSSRDGMMDACFCRIVILSFSCVFYSFAPSVYAQTGGGIAASYRAEPRTIGINYGRIANNLPSPDEAVRLIQQLKVGRVKIFDSDPTVLSALANTGLEVVSAVPNEGIATIASNFSAADQWVKQNVLSYYPATKIVGIVVGNELFSYPALSATTWPQLMPALNYLHQSLVNHNLSLAIKLSTAVALDALATSYPPSTGTFRPDIAIPYMQPLLKFLSSTGSYFYVNAYPYFAWSSDPTQIPLDYALFGANTPGVVDGGSAYYSLLDAQLDAVNAAMGQVGYGGVRLAISESGWPTAGDPTEIGCNLANAASYNRRLVRQILSTSSAGTPQRPGVFIPAFVFSLFNEDLKPGPGTERHWGLLYPNGTAVYSIDMTGQMTDTQYAPLSSAPVITTSAPPPAALANQQPPSTSSSSSNGTWCVSKSSVSSVALQAALDYACGTGATNCVPIQTGGACFKPNTLAAHASYAFNSYWQSSKSIGGSCDFGGAATITTRNPSYGNCVYHAN